MQRKQNQLLVPYRDRAIGEGSLEPGSYLKPGTTVFTEMANAIYVGVFVWPQFIRVFPFRIRQET